MTFPKLITQSEGLAQIPNPEDIGLDISLESIFHNYGIQIKKDQGYNYRDFAHKDNADRVLAFAKGIVEHPETGLEKVVNRQEILRTFINHPELTEFILTQKLVAYYGGPSPQAFTQLLNRTNGYLEYINNLAQLIPEDSNSNLQALRQHILDLDSSEQIQELRAILEEGYGPGIIKIKSTFTIGSSEDKTEMQGIFGSGEKTVDATENRISFSLDNHATKGGHGLVYAVPYTILFNAAVDHIKSIHGEDALSEDTELTLEAAIDQGKDKISGNVSYKKSDESTVETSFEIEATESHKVFNNYPIEQREALLRSDPRLAFAENHLANMLSHKIYLPELQKFNPHIEDFENTLIELRYIATLAKYHNALKELGKDVTIPTLEELGSHIIHAKNLINPNLIGKEEKVIVNKAVATSDQNIYCITGPNKNGKTVYMNSVGIAQAMAQAGMMVLAKEGARFGLVDNIFTHYPTTEVGPGESRYTNELTRGRKLFEVATPNSLILMDEPFTGTEPKDGQHQASGVLQVAEKLGATTFIATHYHGLIDTTEELKYAANLCCVSHWEGETLVYTYKIEEGSSRNSEGLYLAKKMGADKESLNKLITEKARVEGWELRE